MAGRKLIDQLSKPSLSEWQELEIDPRALKPGQLTRIANSTALGEVLKPRDLYRQRKAAGDQFGTDPKSIDLFRYLAWHVDKMDAIDELATDGDRVGEYEKIKIRAAERSAEASKKGRDIGDVPGIDIPLPLENKKRRDSTKKDFTRFKEVYKPDLFYLPSSPAHKRLDKRIEQVILHGGKVPIAMPRGQGKSSSCEAAIEWALLHNWRWFIFLIGANEPAALEILESIRLDLETNEGFAEDFPEVCQPIRALEGIPQRRLLHRGNLVRMELTDDLIQLPWIDGSECGGAAIGVAGLTSAFRGKRVKLPDGRSLRPDLVLLDDPQTRESARSPDQTHKREKIIMGDVLGLGGPGEKIAVLMPCTVIEEGDLADRFLDSNRHPEWDGERVQMLEKFPTDMELWEHYSELRADSLRADGHFKPATRFYEQNRREMDRGARVSWDARFNDDELSALQHAMNLFFEDPAAFAAEYQNQPLLDVPGEASRIPTKDEILQRVNGLGPTVVPMNCETVVAFIDVQQKCLFYLVCAWRSDFTGGIIDYGTWPDQHRRYFSLRDVTKTLAKEKPGAGEDGAIFHGLDMLTQQLFSNTYVREDGAELQLNLCLIDANWKTQTIRTFCRRTRLGALVIPVHGRYVSASAKPISDTPKKKGERVGEEWKTSRLKKQMHIIYDTNYWKTFLHDRLSIPFGDPGNLTLHGSPKDSGLHEMLAEHLVAEYRVRVTSAKGRMVEEYKQRPDKPDNHLLDCAVGCCVAGSMLNCRLDHKSTAWKKDGKDAPLPQRKKKRRRGRGRGGVSYM